MNVVTLKNLNVCLHGMIEYRMNMFVTKRSGVLEEMSFDKIHLRISKLCREFNIITINSTNITIKVIDQVYDKITTTKIDELTAEHCAYSCANHPEYSTLAGALIISNSHKNTTDDLGVVMDQLHSDQSISDTYYGIVMRNRTFFENMLDYSRDYLIDYFGFKTLERAYLLKHQSLPCERVQHLFLRTAVQIHGENLELVKETYDLMSTKHFIHATPTLFNSGTNYPQLSSCYLIGLQEDSLDGIFDTLKECAQISKFAGGIGLHIHNLRAKNAIISSTKGKTTGLTPMLRVFNETAKYVNQGGKRNGSIAVYLEPWHADVEDFLEMKKNHGDEESKARDLFYALWVPNLFMERVERDEPWSLFCPSRAPGLADAYGSAFEELYMRYESEGCATKQISARSLWYKILDSQMETGNPYILYKDHCNNKSNQKNLGTIKSSNLCTEIIEYSDANESAVCTLASIVLPSCVVDGVFDYVKLHAIVKIVTRNLNNVIDMNYYPNHKTRRSNLLHRPIGIGVQGLADTFIMMNIAYNSPEAVEVNKYIFETIYHASVEKSMEISKERTEFFSDFENLTLVSEDFINPNSPTELEKISLYENLHGVRMPLLEKEHRGRSNKHVGSYSSFIGSPTSEGILQFDMWKVSPSGRYDWDILRNAVVEHGIRNSLLVAPMPTASTSQILGYNECFEPITSNIYTRRTLAGEFIVPNKYLMNDLIQLGIWNEQLKNNIILNKGSIAHITHIPKQIRDKYQIVWEIPMKHLVNMAVDRGAYICQSQSLNLWVEDPTYNKLTSMHMYSYKKGLKTAIYYLRRKAKHSAQQFTIEPELSKSSTTMYDICESCTA
jgi:ribonucleotide reductase alpha subunit